VRVGAAFFLATLAATFQAGAAAGEPGRITVGLAAGAVSTDVQASAEAATGGALVEDLGPLRALVLDVSDVDAAVGAVASLAGVEYAEAVTAERSLAFVPNDPLVSSQWYLAAIRAFDHWAEKPPLAPTLVAVVDSGIDAGHPEFGGRIAALKSFVRSPAGVDSFGHGTIVAGEIAAALDNGEGIAGAGIPVQLLVAKVVRSDGDISLLHEARAIRWAVDHGASVVNLSLGGPRDPRDPTRDTYSRLEHAAIDYATRRGVVVVAAAGNCLEAICPEAYANYPAALPHVLGVSAFARNGNLPAFSNRDRVFNDVAAPGTEILSTYPRALSDATCAFSGYTTCSLRPSRRSPRGTSFSAPLVSAAAALLRSEQGSLALPSLHSSQITALLERSALDIGRRGRDAASGNGSLDIDAAVAALERGAPQRDRYETNDDAGARAVRIRGARRTLEATLDRFDDTRDVYRVRLTAGQRLRVELSGPSGGNSNLVLWRPGTIRLADARRAGRLASSLRPGAKERIAYRATRSGGYFVEVRLVGGRSGAYRLKIAKG
jgi:subtilisin family serine protease